MQGELNRDSCCSELCFSEGPRKRSLVFALPEAVDVGGRPAKGVALDTTQSETIHTLHIHSVHDVPISIIQRFDMVADFNT